MQRVTNGNGSELSSPGPWPAGKLQEVGVDRLVPQSRWGTLGAGWGELPGQVGSHVRVLELLSFSVIGFPSSLPSSLSSSSIQLIFLRYSFSRHRIGTYTLLTLECQTQTLRNGSVCVQWRQRNGTSSVSIGNPRPGGLPEDGTHPSFLVSLTWRSYMSDFRPPI